MGSMLVFTVLVEQSAENSGLDLSLIIGVVGILTGLFSLLYAITNNQKSQLKEQEHRTTLLESGHASLEAEVKQRHPIIELEHRLTNLEGETKVLDERIIQRPTIAEVEHRLTELETKLCLPPKLKQREEGKSKE